MSAELRLQHESRWRGRGLLLGLFALFLLPIVAALVLTTALPHWLPFGQVNRGELVQPPLPARLSAVRPLDGAAPLAGEASWLVAHASPAPCRARCRQAIASIRQAWLALGKDAGEVERWWLTPRAVDAGEVLRARELDPGLRVGVLRGDSPLLPAAGGGPALQVVDPAGYLILRYRDAGAADDLHKDLERLIRIAPRAG